MNKNDKAEFIEALNIIEKKKALTRKLFLKQ